MEVKALGPMDRVTLSSGGVGVNSGGGSGGTGSAGQANATVTDAVNRAAYEAEVKRAVENKANQESMGQDALDPIAQQLNKFMDELNADIQFTLHQKTNQLMVQVVDTKDQKVLREFPPKEFLDTVANIREYIGILLDKKA